MERLGNNFFVLLEKGGGERSETEDLYITWGFSRPKPQDMLFGIAPKSMEKTLVALRTIKFINYCCIIVWLGNCLLMLPW